MNQLASINIAHAIACDDIRQETNGKFILIGAYSGNIGLPFFPIQIAIGFWMLAKPSQKGDYQVQFRIKGPGDEEVLASGQMTVHVQEQENTALVIPPIPLSIKSAGDIKLQYQEGSESWITICNLQAKLVPSPLRSG
jgi:hypothetical protein